MNDNKLPSLISFLFTEDRKKFGVAPSKVKKRLAALWKKTGKTTKKGEKK